MMTGHEQRERDAQATQDRHQQRGPREPGRERVRGRRARIGLLTVAELKIVATAATTTDPPMYRAMFEIPDACPT